MAILAVLAGGELTGACFNSGNMKMNFKTGNYSTCRFLHASERAGSELP
jgi:hypothetical protein